MAQTWQCIHQKYAWLRQHSVRVDICHFRVNYAVSAQTFVSVCSLHIRTEVLLTSSPSSPWKISCYKKINLLLINSQGIKALIYLKGGEGTGLARINQLGVSQALERITQQAHNGGLFAKLTGLK